MTKFILYTLFYQEKMDINFRVISIISLSTEIG
jgi:hypothetical protein